MNKLTPTEISVLESSVGHRFPSPYRRMLGTVGHGDSNDNTTIYHPEEITTLYSNHFESETDLYTKYFPVGCNNTEQTLWIVDVATDRIATISHETHPDDYYDEEWLELDEWLASNAL